MKHGVRRATIACGFAAALAAGCAQQEQQTLKSLQQPINCATAEGDIRVLQSEKAHTAQQIAQGVAAITPAGFVLGALTGTEGTKVQVASGEYNTMIGQPDCRDQGDLRCAVGRDEAAWGRPLRPRPDEGDASR